MPEDVLVSDHIISVPEWGLDCQEVMFDKYKDKIFGCYASVSNFQKIAQKLADSVINDSWITRLDKGTQRVYSRTSRETAESLVEIFREPKVANGNIDESFGEVLVSIGAAQTLSTIFEHVALPIAELWKPQLKQNEGFDFHTVCSLEYINYGEAKFSLLGNPHGRSSSQANRFFSEEKHFRDRVHLVNLVGSNAIANLDDELYGAVIAFSINSKDVKQIFLNSIKAIEEKLDLYNVSKIYMVGVGCNGK